jgi:signal transduction histidine kinase
LPKNPASSSSASDAAKKAADVEGGDDTVIMTRGARTGGPAPTAGEFWQGSLPQVLDHLGDGLVTVDLTGRFIEFNRAAVTIVGKGAVSLPPDQWPQAYGLFLPDTVTQFPHEQLPLVRALAGETTQETEIFVRNDKVPDGKWLLVRAAPLFDERKRQIGAIAMFRDDTKRRLAEQALEVERKYLRHLIRTQDRDRQLTAFDMHDGIVQLMTGALMRLDAQRGKNPAAETDEDLRVARDLVREAIEEARRMIGGLRPPSIDEKGVIGAIEYLADAQNQGGMQVEFVHDVKFTRLTSLQETTLYRIVQEALHNAQRHSGSERARVVLKQRGKTIYLEIRDWGKGFDPKTTRLRRFGLRGIEERSRLLGGTVRIDSSPQQGTLIRVTLPLDAASLPDSSETET